MQSVGSHTSNPARGAGDTEVSGTRSRILWAAEEVMSEKGLAGSSISEIARKAGVADSVIYQYFKGKQDLLFSVPGERMKEVLAILVEQLTGIQDVQSQLRKMIWFHLRYNDTHRGYARLLLLECRSSKAFYDTPAYSLVREYANILRSIIEQGIKEEKFRADIQTKLVRDVILGTLDMESLGSLASGEILESEADFEDIMTLVDAMICLKEPQGTRRINRMDAIMNAAQKVFAEKDFHQARISEIAKLVGISDATVYEYFQNKEDILLSLAAKRFDTYLLDVSNVFEIKDPARKLRRLIKYHFGIFLSEREFLKIFLLQLQLNKCFYGSKAFDAFRSYYSVIEDVIQEGKEAGIFSSAVNTRVFRNMFLGAFSHLALRWLIVRESTDTDRMEEINEVTDLLASAVTAQPVRQPAQD
jgi:TetR/AcrR family fatty acid metabolism transcriptional regulator